MNTTYEANGDMIPWPREGDSPAARLSRMTDDAQDISPRLDDVVANVRDHLGDQWAPFPAMTARLAAKIEDVLEELGLVEDVVRNALTEQKTPPDGWADIFS